MDCQEKKEIDIKNIMLELSSSGCKDYRSNKDFYDDLLLRIHEFSNANNEIYKENCLISATLLCMKRLDTTLISLKKEINFLTETQEIAVLLQEVSQLYNLSTLDCNDDEQMIIENIIGYFYHFISKRGVDFYDACCKAAKVGTFVNGLSNNC